MSKTKILLNYIYDFYPFTTASYLDMAIRRRPDLSLLHLSDLSSESPDFIINIEPVREIVSIPGVPSCYWEIDNHVIKGADRHFYDKVDFVLLAQKYFKDYYSDYKAFYVPLAADPECHVPCPEQSIIYDFGLLGNDTYAERRRLLEKLEACFRVLRGESAPGLPYSQKLSQCRYIFNKSMELDINMRVFEAMAIGRPLITDEIPFQDEFFVDGKHLITYDSELELFSKIDYYDKHPHEREAIAIAARDNIIKYHTYDHRLCLIEKILKGQVSPL
jgi:hypothetical protein